MSPHRAKLVIWASVIFGVLVTASEGIRAEDQTLNLSESRLRQLVYEEYVPWALRGDANSRRGKFWRLEKVNGKPSVEVKSIKTGKLFDSVEFYQTKTLNKRFVETADGPTFTYAGMLIRDEKKAVFLRSEEDVLKALAGPLIKQPEDMVVLCRLFSLLSGKRLTTGPPEDGIGAAVLPEKITSNTNIWHTAVVRKKKGVWQASFTAIAPETCRLVRYTLDVEGNSVQIAQREVLFKGLTFI